MCFNATASLITFSIALFCSAFLIYKGLRSANRYQLYIGIIVLLIGNMQLLEYFLWKFQNNRKLNHLASLMIMVVLYLQVTVAFVLYSVLFNKTSPLMTAVVIFNTMFTAYLLFWLNQRALFTTPQSGSCRLIWAPYLTMQESKFGRVLNIIHAALYFYIASYVLLKLSNMYNRYPVTYTFLPLTAFIAFVYAVMQNGKHWGAIFSSFWCFIAVGFGVVASLGI